MRQRQSTTVTQSQGFSISPTSVPKEAHDHLYRSAYRSTMANKNIWVAAGDGELGRVQVFAG